MARKNELKVDAIKIRAESYSNVHSDAEMDDVDLTPAMLSLA